MNVKEKLSQLREKMGVISLHDLKQKLGFTSADKKKDRSEMNEGRSDLKKDQRGLMGEIATATSDRLSENLEYIHRISKAYNSDFLAILQPYKFLHPEYYKYKDKTFSDFYRQVTVNVLEHDRGYIKDLTVPFKDLKREELEIYYSDRVHFTAIGYKEVAAEILKLIRQR